MKLRKHTTGSRTIASSSITFVPPRRFSRILISRWIFFFFTGYKFNPFEKQIRQHTIRLTQQIHQMLNSMLLLWDCKFATLYYCKKRKVQLTNWYGCLTATVTNLLLITEFRVSSMHTQSHRGANIRIRGVNKRKCTVAELVTNYYKIFYRINILCMM